VSESEVVRIFIGCGANNEDLEFQSVLHYTLEKYASMPLDITWMRLTRNPKSFWYAEPQHDRGGWSTRSWHTPFSALRWGIPAFCNFQGKAIYLDVDMVARDDIAKLWNQPFRNGSAMIAHSPNICVSLYNNAEMRHYLPPIDRIKRSQDVYRNLRRNFSGAAITQQPAGGNWNCLDGKRIGTVRDYGSIADPEIKILHFTHVPTQPHLPYAMKRLRREGKQHWYEQNLHKEDVRPHPRADARELFDRLLQEADEAGYSIDRYRVATLFGDYGRW
jgi:hypothetical protein